MSEDPNGCLEFRSSISSVGSRLITRNDVRSRLRVAILKSLKDFTFLFLGFCHVLRHPSTPNFPHMKLCKMKNTQRNDRLILPKCLCVNRKSFLIMLSTRAKSSSFTPVVAVHSFLRS